MPFYPFIGEGSPTKIDKPERNRGYPYSNLSNLEDLVVFCFGGESSLRVGSRFIRGHMVTLEPLKPAWGRFEESRRGVPNFQVPCVALPVTQTTHGVYIYIYMVEVCHPPPAMVMVALNHIYRKVYVWGMICLGLWCTLTPSRFTMINE